MLRSMTGFGASTSVTEGLELRVEVRSVNHRHLQVKTRAAPELAYLEGDLERQVKKRVERGAVTVYLNVARDKTAARAAFDRELVRRYRDDIRELGREIGLALEPSFETLLALPGVVRAPDNELVPSQALEKRLLALLDAALDALLEARAQEGKALETDLRKHAGLLDTIVARIEKRMPRVVREHQKQLRKRVDELLAGQTPPTRPEDLGREIALLADRLDVSEELARLRSHMEQLVLLLDKGGAIGRHLDFLVQELVREVNTIGSKCNDAKVAHWVVDAKTHVERLREQLQNVE